MLTRGAADAVKMGGVCLLASLLAAMASSPSLGEDAGESACLRCHEGIESIGAKHYQLECTDCHAGDGKATSKQAAHKGIHADPGALDVVDETCGLCHEEETERVKKSLHATNAGIISGARYLWAAQEGKGALYSVRQVADEDGLIPAQMGALGSLEKLPHFKDSGEPIDDYLRNLCLRCHLWTKGAARAGDYRGAGCTACHMLYADDGLSKSGDRTISKSEPGHPIRHEITSRIPSRQCAHCHIRGARIGMSYMGMMESDGYGTPFNPDGSRQAKLHGKNYNHLKEDLHYEAGLHCIDCHTLNDVHGDGNIYSKKHEAVEIECADCHGTPEKYSTLKTSRQRDLGNLQRRNDEVYLKSKVDDRLHAVPQLAALQRRRVLPVAMQISAHMEKLECYACHAVWAPQCYGCHAKMDMRARGYDWVDEAADATYAWTESRSYLRWESPTLGINSEGKVSPFIPGCQAIFTQIDEDGKPVVSNKVFTTADGLSGLAHNPVNPHTISRRPRTCEDCHSNPKALGLGSGHYVTKANGVDLPFELERIVDEEGNQIQATSHVGARPFNKEELERINRVNVCLGCHQEMPTAFWKDVEERWGEADTTKKHHDLLREVLRKSVGVSDGKGQKH